MAKPKQTTVRRLPTYLGPDRELVRAELFPLDAQKTHFAQHKVDGMWCEFTVGRPCEGRPNVLMSRDANTGPVSGSNAGDLALQCLPVDEGTILIGELEAASQWAKKQNDLAKVRRIHLFDIVQLGSEDLKAQTNLQRYVRLAQVYQEIAQIPEYRERFLLVPIVMTGFESYYDEALAEGYEGLVLKPRDGKYETSRLDGKRDDWFRCKRRFTSDYVLIGTAMTPGGKTSKPKPNGIWGLWDPKKGEWVEVMRTGMRTAAEAAGLKEQSFYDCLDQHQFKLVVEFSGWERFKSGALRHAQSVRVRTDKAPKACLVT
jgi:hypothetical protein